MTSPRHNRAQERDWTALDFLIALRERGLTWQKISAGAGYKGTALRNAVDKRYPKAEAAIAKALDLPPAAIWPSRYPPKRGLYSARKGAAAPQAEVA
jgi:Ner family transcriptional regulator